MGGISAPSTWQFAALVDWRGFRKASGLLVCSGMIRALLLLLGYEGEIGGLEELIEYQLFYDNNYVFFCSAHQAAEGNINTLHRDTFTS